MQFTDSFCTGTFSCQTSGLVVVSCGQVGRQVTMFLVDLALFSVWLLFSPVFFYFTCIYTHAVRCKWPPYFIYHWCDLDQDTTSHHSSLSKHYVSWFGLKLCPPKHIFSDLTGETVVWLFLVLNIHYVKWPTWGTFLRGAPTWHLFLGIHHYPRSVLLSSTRSFSLSYLHTPLPPTENLQNTPLKRKPRCNARHDRTAFAFQSHTMS